MVYTDRITYEPVPGEDISTSCRQAVALADKHGLRVSFRFNGIDLVASPGESPVAVQVRWRAESDRQAAAYRNSPEGKAAAGEAESRRRLAQRQTDALIARLPGVVGNLGALVRWLVELSQAADHVGVKWSRSKVIAALEAAGHREDAHVGRPPEDFDDRRTMGEYIAGQAIACMRRGMPPHPVIDKFAREAGFISPAPTEAV